MTYYEELGVARTAPEAEIRRAYKTLMRQLHPDRQLQRITAIATVLLDPELRARYDEDLDAEERRRARLAIRPLGPPRTIALPDLAPSRATWVWLGAAAFGILAIAFFLREQPAPMVGQAPWPAPDPLVRPAQAPAPPPSPAPAPAPSSSVAHALMRAEPALMPALVAEPPEPAPPSVVPPLPSTPAPQPPAPQAPAAPGFSGRWVFTRDYYEPGEGLYAPEYIELALREERRQVRGDYRARYAVGNKPISPSVAFTFEGSAEQDQAQLPWIAPSGAKGQIQLKLRNDGTLTVNWWATQLGSRPELASGTAVLIRLKEARP